MADCWTEPGRVDKRCVFQSAARWPEEAILPFDAPRAASIAARHQTARQTPCLVVRNLPDSASDAVSGSRGNPKRSIFGVKE